MIVYPEGCFYSEVKKEDIPEIVEEFDKNDVFQYHFEYVRGSFKKKGIIKDKSGKIFAYI